MTERAYLVKLETHVIVWPAKATLESARAEAELQLHNAKWAEGERVATEGGESLWHLDGVRAVGTPTRAPEHDRD